MDKKQVFLSLLKGEAPRRKSFLQAYPDALCSQVQ